MNSARIRNNALMHLQCMLRVHDNWFVFGNLGMEEFDQREIGRQRLRNNLLLRAYEIPTHHPIG